MRAEFGGFQWASQVQIRAAVKSPMSRIRTLAVLVNKSTAFFGVPKRGWEFDRSFVHCIHSLYLRRFICRLSFVSIVSYVYRAKKKSYRPMNAML